MALPDRISADYHKKAMRLTLSETCHKITRRSNITESMIEIYKLKLSKVKLLRQTSTEDIDVNEIETFARLTK